MKDSESTMVQSLLNLKDQLDLIVKTCFQDDPQFINSLREAFEVSINKRRNLPAEYIG